MSLVILPRPFTGRQLMSLGFPILADVMRT